MTIKEAREKAGLTQTQLADKIWAQQAAIARWENGGRDPKLETLQKIAKACGVNVLDLLGTVGLRETVSARSVIDNFLTRKIEPDETHDVEQGKLVVWHLGNSHIGMVTEGGWQIRGQYAYRNTISPQGMADDIMLDSTDSKPLPQVL